MTLTDKTLMVSASGVSI